MLNILLNNPFRVLGVYSNARPAEIVSNCDDMEAYLSIGQSVSFDLDLNNLMPTVVRTTGSVSNAKTQINLPKDKLKHALFWFVKDSSSAHALNYLKNGDFSNANDIFEMEDSFATRINKAVAALMQNDLGSAIANVTELIHDFDELGLRDGFVKAICGDTFSIEENDLAHLYIDTLLEEKDASELRDLFQEHGVSQDDDDYLKEKAVNEPISRINTEIAKAKAVERDDANANLRAGKALMDNTKADLAAVKDLLGESDMKYQMIADDLANTILQCGINYYNNTDDDDDIENTMGLQKYACKIAVGQMCKDRCNKNLAILEKKKRELPPDIVKEEDIAIKASILNKIVLSGQTIDNAIAMMKECASHIVAIKEQIEEHPEIKEYYLNISTQVVNAALSSVISEHNDTLEHATSSDYFTVKNMLKKAWKATLMMDKFDLESDFKNGRYAENRSALKNMCDNVLNIYELPSISNSDIDLRSEEEVWNECRTLQDYKAYLERYPNAKHKKAAKSRYDKLYAEKEEKERQERLEREADDRTFNSCTTISDYQEYLRKYPNGRHKTEAAKKIAEKKDGISKAIKWVAVILGIIVWVASGGFGWGLLVGGIGFFIELFYNS